MALQFEEPVRDLALTARQLLGTTRQQQADVLVGSGDTGELADAGLASPLGDALQLIVINQTQPESATSNYYITVLHILIYTLSSVQRELFTRSFVCH